MAKFKDNKDTSPVWWVNYTLSEEELARFAGQKLSEKQMLDAVASLVDDGYRITFGLDDRSASCLCCFFSASDDPHHPNQALSSRSPDMAEALAINLFKHHEIFEGRWPKRTTKKAIVRG